MLLVSERNLGFVTRTIHDEAAKALSAALRSKTDQSLLVSRRAQIDTRRSRRGSLLSCLWHIILRRLCTYIVRTNNVEVKAGKSLGIAGNILVNHTTFHHKLYPPHSRDVLQRIAFEGDDVCLEVGSDSSDLVRHTECFCTQRIG